MNVEELLDVVDFILDNNDGQTSQAFSAARKLKVLNLCYKTELTTARLEANWLWTKSTRDVTWPSGQVTLVLPEDVVQAGILAFRDVTSNDPGVEIMLGNDQDTGRPFWRDSRTLQWGAEGPGEEKTFRFVYWPQAVKLVEDEDIPSRLPEEHHELLAWSTACWLSTVADQDRIPQLWRMKLDELRKDMYKFMSLNRPAERSNTVAVRHLGSEEELGFG